jgi:regulator of sirC expression with transglutaminase-like and TPR domain
VERQMGACVSLPSIVVAVARRLGYPVYLVNCSMHSFVRWDDGKERFTNR